MTPNPVRDVLNRSLNHQNNDVIGVKMLLAGQMPAAALDIIYPPNVGLRREVVVYAFLIWMSIPEQLLSSDSNYLLGANIYSGFGLMTFTELINKRRNTSYSKLKTLLGTNILNIPRAVSNKCDSTTASDRRYTTGEIFSIIPYTRAGVPIYSNLSKISLQQDYQERGVFIQRNDIKAILVSVQFNPEEIREAYESLEIFVSSLPGAWQSGNLIHQAHKEVNLEELVAYAFTKAYPIINHSAKDIIVTIHKIAQTHLSTMQMVATMDLDPTRFGKGESIERFLDAWDNVDRFLKQGDQTIVRTIFEKYKNEFTSQEFYELLKVGALDGQAGQPSIRFLSDFESIVRRFPERFGFVNSIILTLTPEIDISYDKDFIIHPIASNRIATVIKNVIRFNEMSINNQFQMLKNGAVEIQGPFNVIFRYITESECLLPDTNIKIVDSRFNVSNDLSFSFLLKKREINSDLDIDIVSLS